MTYPQYSVENLKAKLEVARLYRGYESQNEFCKYAGIARQQWNLWVKGQNLPNIKILVHIANVLKINFLYFVTTNAEIGDYDFMSERAKYKDVENSLESKLMPFTETHNSRKIFQILKSALLKRQIIAIETDENTGASRSIMEFRLLQADSILVFDESNFRSDYLENIDATRLVIFDHTDKFIKEEWYKILDFARKFLGSVIFTGKNVMEDIKALVYDRQINETYALKAISFPDFEHIIKQALPDISIEIITLFKWHTNLDLNKAFDILHRIYEKKSEDSKFIMTFESIMRLL